MARHMFRAVVIAHSGASNEVAFRRTWKSLQKFALFQFFLRHSQFVDRQSSLQTQIMSMYSRFAPDLYGQAKSLEPSAIQEILRIHRPLLLIDFHQGHPGVTKSLCEAGVEHYRIVADPVYVRMKARSIGLDETLIHAVGRSAGSLVFLRNAARNRRVVCCSIDFKRHNEYKFVSPAVLEVARLTAITVVFLKSYVDEEGQMHLLHSAPMQIENSIAAANAMIEFFNSTPGDQRTMSVAKYRKGQNGTFASAPLDPR
ncbi:hypothetical protein [Rhizobium sp. PAMB 3182]